MALLVWNGPKGETRRHLENETRIGRSPTNEVSLSDIRASVCHARILRHNDRWIFEDLGSTNGSFVNGRRKTRAILSDGDAIRIGLHDLTFRDPAFPPAAGVAPAVTEQAKESAARRSTTFHIGELQATDRTLSTVTTLKSDGLELAPQHGASSDCAMLTRRLNACYEIAKATSAQLNLSDVMDRVLEALFQIFANADRAFILLIDPVTNQVNATAVKRRVAQDTDTVSISRTALEAVIRERKAALCLDAMSDGRYAGAQSVITHAIRSLMIAPLIFQGQVLGAIHVDTNRSAGVFTEADLELLGVAAAQVAGCVANAQLHEKVVAAERLAAIGETVAGLSHCIKNILQGIQGGAFIVEKGMRDEKPETLKMGWEMVRRNNAFMEELVFDLLSFCKRREPEYAISDLNALCAEVSSLAAARAEDKGVSVTFVADPLLTPVEVDPRGVRRCVLNLVMNAVDASAGMKGTVTVRTQASAEEDRVRITVQDTGCGMSEQTKTRLFTAFFSTKGSKGTGLGLSVTKKIVEEHGGHIEVESKEGAGTTFAISLPRTLAVSQQKGDRNGHKS